MRSLFLKCQLIPLALICLKGGLEAQPGNTGLTKPFRSIRDLDRAGYRF